MLHQVSFLCRIIFKLNIEVGSTENFDNLGTGVSIELNLAVSELCLDFN